MTTAGRAPSKNILCTIKRLCTASPLTHLDVAIRNAQPVAIVHRHHELLEQPPAQSLVHSAALCSGAHLSHAMLCNPLMLRH